MNYKKLSKNHIMKGKYLLNDFVFIYFKIKINEKIELVKIEQQKSPRKFSDFFYSLCKNDCRFKRVSSLSTWSSSGTQQSTGQTAAHCGSSWKPLHSVHFPGTI